MCLAQPHEPPAAGLAVSRATRWWGGLALGLCMLSVLSPSEPLPSSETQPVAAWGLAT